MGTISMPRSLAQLCPKPWAKLPNGLGHICSSVMLTHVRGHGYSCTRVWMLMYMSKHSHDCGQNFINSSIYMSFNRVVNVAEKIE